MSAKGLHERTDAIRRAFEHSSGRVIALSRLVLATIFFLALWIDPDQPARSSAVGYSLLFAYMVLAAGLLVLAWSNWWWDYRLASPVMMVDVLAFLSAVFFTEGAASDFTSPFLAFFAFLILAATIRWDWRATLLIGLAVTVLYLLVGLYISTIDGSFDTYRFGRRISYMLVLTLVLAWFGLQRREPAIERFVEFPEQPGEPPTLLDQALAYATGQSGASRAAIAWTDYEEPDTRLLTTGPAAPQRTLGPAEFDSDTGYVAEARLFDRRRNRSLVARTNRRPTAMSAPVQDPLATYCEIEQGLALPLLGLTGRGELLLAGIPGLCVDHVRLGALLAREVTAAFDRQATLGLASESALARMRDSLARDLHDSVAQSLAGASLRLEGLRTWIRGGGDPEAEIDAMKQSLREEQRHVRSLIEQLRQGAPATDVVEAGAEVQAVLTALANQWSVDARLAFAGALAFVPAWVAHEIGQVLREAVANAVRHGGAARIDVDLASTGEELRLTIVDDGAGFAGGAAIRPKSISERVEKLGGRLAIETGPTGTALEVTLRARPG